MGGIILMANNNDHYDPHTESKLLLNGKQPCWLNEDLCFIQDTVDQHSGHSPLSERLQEVLKKRLSTTVIPTPDAERRRMTVQNCCDRQVRGIPLSRSSIRDSQKEWREEAQSFKHAITNGLINKQGEFNSELLAKLIAKRGELLWPVDETGAPKTDRATLEQLESELSNTLLRLKNLYRDLGIMKISTDNDGRYRYWANPFGTKTGRECPKGPALNYWPKGFRDLITPDTGQAVATIDFVSQEPAILAAFADDEQLIAAYENGDLYQYVQELGAWGKLSRKQIKRLVISFIYGADQFSIRKQFEVSALTAELWYSDLRRIFTKLTTWMDRNAYDAYSKGHIKSLDWGMAVHKSTPIKSIKNWPIQAAGADILRRTCLQLAGANIDVVGALHDSVLIEVPLVNHKTSIATAQQIMQRASASVLDGIPLRTTVEQIYLPENNSKI